MKKISIFTLLLLMGGFVNCVYAYNIAHGLKPELYGVYGTDQGGWEYHEPAAATTLTDGTFITEPALWNLNSVWWNGITNPGNEIIIRLGSQLGVNGFSIQADDNDTYLVEFKASDIDEWATIFTVLPVNTWGLRTRTINFSYIEYIETLRITAVDGDGYYSLSEIQVFSDKPHPDAPVPEPSTVVLLLAGLFTLWLMRNRENR